MLGPQTNEKVGNSRVKIFCVLESTGQEPPRTFWPAPKRRTEKKERVNSVVVMIIIQTSAGYFPLWSNVALSVGFGVSYPNHIINS